MHALLMATNETTVCECCGLSYGSFRSGVTFAAAYEWTAFDSRRAHTGRATVLRAMARAKRQEWALHLEGCAAYVPDAEPTNAADFQD
jgi:anaerobic ribonucleoside-triphosphate reductase